MLRKSQCLHLWQYNMCIEDAIAHVHGATRMPTIYIKVAKEVVWPKPDQPDQFHAYDHVQERIRTDM